MTQFDKPTGSTASPLVLDTLRRRGAPHCSPTFFSHKATIQPDEEAPADPREVEEPLVSVLDPAMREENGPRYYLARCIELAKTRPPE